VAPGQDGATGGLLRERDRVVRRLRSMSLEAIPLARVLAVGQALADLTATASGSQVRVVPWLAPHAAADQIAVLVGEVEATAAASTTDPATDPANVEALLEQARVVLADLRRDL
jgi:hypothetical protein